MNGSRRGEEADFGAKNKFRLVTSAATALARILELNLVALLACSPRLDVEKMSGRLKAQGQWVDAGGFQTKLAGRNWSFFVAMNRIEPPLQNANDFNPVTAELEKFTAQHLDRAH